MSKEHEYRDKLIRLIDMINALPYTVSITEWDTFLKEVAIIGIDNDERRN